MRPAARGSGRCRRCRPDGVSPQARQAGAVARACRLIEAAESPPNLATLAGAVGLSRHYFRHVFTQVLGVTPRQYAAAHRARRVRTELRAQPSVTEAIYAAGFNASSRFYEHSSEALGMTPSEFRNGGGGVAVRHAIAACPLGLVLVAGTARGICAVRFGDKRAALERDLRRDFPKASMARAGRDFDAWVKTVVNHVKHPAAGLTCRWTSGARHFSNGCGRRCAKSRRGRRPPMRKWRRALGGLKHRGPWRMRARRTRPR